jgi:NAD(P)-dependent dehydrogenase (short-subunit alcohol dehydrogenase family)
MAVRLDVTKQDEIDAAVELIGKEGRGLRGIVNNAGVNAVAPLIEADLSELEFLFDVNVFGVFRVAKAFAPLIIESHDRIVNISSMSGFLSGTGYGI